MKDKRAFIVNSYAKFCKKTNRFPTSKEFQKATSITKDMISHYFGSMKELKKEAMTSYPKDFDRTVDDLFTHNKVASLKSNIKKFDTFFTTTAVFGCEIHADFLSSINSFCTHKKALFLAMMAQDPAASVTKNGFVDPLLNKNNIVVSNVSLNNNLHLSTIKLSAKQINPTTGLGRLGRREGSFIYASPKQSLKLIPWADSKYPHSIMTTGAITKPDYNTDMYMSERTAYIAQHDHVMGGIIVEIEGDNTYHFRQVQMEEDGSFIDLGMQYFPDGRIEKAEVEAVVLGDLHVGSENGPVMAAWEKLVKDLKPKNLVIHDLFDGVSVNYHYKDNIIYKSLLAEMGNAGLEDELYVVSSRLKELSSWADNIEVVKSNHDAFLDKYLQEGLYVKDPINHKISLKLALALLDGANVVEYYAKELSGIKGLDSVRFLGIDESFRLADTELGVHGHLGSNGAKGSIAGLETAYGNIIFGHTHTPEILRGACCVGTSTDLQLSYNHGASSWLNTSAILYRSGARQLINCIDSKYTL